MPSLRLPKLPRCDPERPSLKQRAEALKASAARVLRRKPAAAIQPEPDPILAAIDASRRAEAAVQAFGRRLAGRRMTKAEWAEEGGLVAEQGRARDAVWQTLPTTRAGQLALLDYGRFQLDLHGFDPDVSPQDDSCCWQEAYHAVAASLAAGVAAEPSPRA